MKKKLNTATKMLKPKTYLTMNMQTEIDFKDNNKLFEKHSLRYHLLKIGVDEIHGKIHHINSLFEGYNSDGYPVNPTDSRMRKYYKVHSVGEIRDVLKSFIDDGRHHYLMAAFDYDLIKSMSEFID